MTLRTSIIAASSALALIAPAAASARAVSDLDGHMVVSVKHGVHALKSTSHKATGSKTKTGTAKKTASAGIYTAPSAPRRS